MSERFFHANGKSLQSGGQGDGNAQAEKTYEHTGYPID
jgi:hypothetical protein